MNFPFEVNMIPITATKHPLSFQPVIALLEFFLKNLCKISVTIGPAEPIV